MANFVAFSAKGLKPQNGGIELCRLVNYVKLWKGEIDTAVPEMTSAFVKSCN